MLLIKTFNPLKFKQVVTATNLSRVGTTDKVMARDAIGIITFRPFEATLMRGFEGISIDGDQNILVNVGSGFVSMTVARAQIKLITGTINLSLKLLKGRSFKSVSIGYWVDADPVTYLLNTGLPARLQTPWLLTRYLQAGEVIGGVNPARIQQTSGPIQTSNGIFRTFAYYPLIVSTQNYYQGEEVPSIVLRLEQYSNRRMMNGSDFVLKTVNEAYLQSIAECVDIDFELSIVAANTQDLLSGIDSITRSFSDGFIEAPPFGLSFGVQLSRSAVFDEMPQGRMSQEIEFANLPSASMKLRLVNVPIGFDSSVAGVLTGIEGLRHTAPIAPIPELPSPVMPQISGNDIRFSQINLVDSNFTMSLPFEGKPSSIAVYDGEGQEVGVSSRIVGGELIVDLADFTPIVGQWVLSVSR